MHPQTKSSQFRLAAVCAAGLLALPAAALAQQDTPSVDVSQLLQALRAMRRQQEVQVKTQKQNAYQTISAAAGSNERAVALYEEAIKATQMDGAGKEGAQFKAWKEGEGEAFKEPVVQNAVRMHFEWMALTLQRSQGATVKDMLAAIIRYTQELQQDEANMLALQDAIAKEKEQGGNNAKKAQKSRDDVAIKRSHDNILKKNLNSSPAVQWMKLADFLAVDKWEMVPSDYDGIYKNIILPELRQEKDMRVFEYWDLKLKKEADNASKSKLTFEIDKFNSQKRPILLWNRAQEFANLGMKNRGVTEMFNLIKQYPTHPDADDWIAKLESVLLPPAPTAPPGTDAGNPAATAPTAAPAAPAPLPPIPGATAPAPGAPALPPIPAVPSSTSVLPAPGSPTPSSVPGL